MRAARREPRGAADQDRRQSGSSVEPRRDRRLRAGGDLGALRSGSVADHHQPRRDPAVQRVCRRGAGVLVSAAGEAGRRHPDTLRNGRLADAGSPARRLPRRGSRAPSGCSGSRSAATTRARAAGWRSASTWTRSTPSRRPTSSCRSTPISCAPGRPACKHARAFASRRRVEGDRAQANRLYAVESTPTNTGTRADHRLPLRAVRDRGVRARALPRSSASRGAAAAAVRRPPAAWIAPLVKDLQAHRGQSVVIAGDGQPPVVHALAHAMNDALGNVGATVVYTQTAEARPMNQLAGLRELVGEMNAGTVEFLLILGGNPVYTAPVGPRISPPRCRRSRCARISASTKTRPSALCHWHIPEAHFLEAWSDVRADDGTVDDRSAADRAALRRQVGARSDLGARRTRRAVRLRAGARVLGRARRACRRQAPAPPPAVPAPRRCCQPQRRRRRTHRQTRSAPAAPAPHRRWRRRRCRSCRRSIANGANGCTTASSRTPRSRRDGRGAGQFRLAAAGAGGLRRRHPGLEVVFRPDPSVYDGRFANNAWLQELPKSLTKLTWDNAALISPATAARLALVSGDVVELRQGGRTVRIPVWLAPGQAPDTLTLHLGYGRTRAGRAGNGTGFNVNALRTTAAPDILTGVELVEDRRQLRARLDAGSLVARRAQSRARRHGGAVRRGSAVRARRWSSSRSPGLTMYGELQVRGLRLGHGDRSERLHRLQRLRRRLPGGEQHPGRRQVAGAERPRDALAARRPVLHRRPRESRHLSPADARASSARRRRARWSAPWRRPSTATKA